MKVQLVKNETEGFDFTKKVLYEKCGKDTVLFLSGGKTPRHLYEDLAKDRKLKLGALAMVDDRYSLHEQYSNEFMIRDSGLVSFLGKGNVPFYPILRYGLNRVQTAREYERDVKFLFERFKKKLAILGIGSDGHIASIAPRSNDLNHDIKLAVGINDFPAEIRERITLTLNAISKMDLIIILVFGKKKGEGIKIALRTFFSGKDISKKTILITDQKV